MPMKKDQIPEIFIHSLFLSCLTGTGCALVTVIMFFVAGDRTLLYLGGIASVLCIGKGIVLYRTVKLKRYEIIEGVCFHADYPMKRPYPRIRIEQPDGQSISLILDRKQQVLHGHAYRFYFKLGAVPDPKEAIWFQSFRSDGIIGIEEIPVSGGTDENNFSSVQKIGV